MAGVNVDGEPMARDVDYGVVVLREDGDKRGPKQLTASIRGSELDRRPCILPEVLVDDRLQDRDVVVAGGIVELVGELHHERVGGVDLRQ